MDNLIIPFKNKVQGIEKLKLLLQTTSKYWLKINIKKCNFLKLEIDFLGYRIKNGKLYLSPLQKKCCNELFGTKMHKEYRKSFVINKVLSEIHKELFYD